MDSASCWFVFAKHKTKVRVCLLLLSQQKIYYKQMKYVILALAICIVLAQTNLCNSTLPGCSLCTSNTSICLTCNPNYYLINNTCLQCADGQYSPGGNSSACLSCSQGCSGCNATQCTACEPNYQFNNGSCSACPTGTYSAGGTDNCVSCPDNCYACSYDPTQRQITCSNCSVNYGISGGAC